MTIEDVLIELGEDRLAMSRYSRMLLVMLNAFLPGDKPISIDMSGHEILTMVYQLPNEEMQNKILQRKVGDIRGSDSYRNSVLFIAIGAGVLTIWLALSEVSGFGNTASLVRWVSSTVSHLFKMFVPGA